MAAPTVVSDRPNPRVRVVRLARPDPRSAIYDGEPSQCELARDIRAAVFADLGPGDGVVLNCGLLEWFPSVLFQVFLDLRTEAQSKGGKFILCRLPVDVREAFDVMGGGRLFEVRATEARAVAELSK